MKKKVNNKLTNTYKKVIGFFVVSIPLILNLAAGQLQASTKGLISYDLGALGFFV